MVAGHIGQPGAAAVWRVVVEHKHVREHASIHLRLVAVRIAQGVV